MYAPGLTKAEAARTVRAFRSDHVIDPEFPRDTRQPHNWCRTCGVAVYPVKNGWRHDVAEVVVLSDIAGTAL